MGGIAHRFQTYNMGCAANPIEWDTGNTLI